MAPFSLLYKWVMQFRNHLYDIGYKPSFEFDQLVIAVGNLSVGGTGKTPMIEFLTNYFIEKHSSMALTTLSRGYGRKSKGFILADENSTAKQIGDEPLQIYRKFQQNINVAVCEDRVLAVPSILLERPENQVVLLDDAFQHRSIKPNLSLMLTDYNRPFYEDYVLPAGMLREGRSGANRAEIIVVTKCPPTLDDRSQELIKDEIKAYAPNSIVFFTTIGYTKVNSELVRAMNKNVILLTGIANTDSLVNYLEQEVNICKHLQYSDHHHFSAQEISEAMSLANHLDADILTTEKDWVRIMSDETLAEKVKDKLFYQPMTVQFLNGEEKFTNMVDNYIHDFTYEYKIEK